MTEKKKKITIYILSFLLPVISWIISCALNGIYPFGDATIMTGDITYQFIDYLSYFKSIILGNNDFTYTFSKTMGGDMMGFSAYYLSSPFNYFFLLFPNDLFPLAFLIMIICKSGLIGLSFEIMLTKLYGLKYESIVFSFTYALMGYIVVYYQLYAYYDNLILLPLIILGIHNIYEDSKKRLFYIVCLFLSVFINYYVAFMICIFSVLYFAYLTLLNGYKKSATISFITSSIFGGLMSAFSLISALMSMRGEKDNFNFGIHRNFRMLDVFCRLYPDSFKGNISTCLPNIYCGILPIILLVLFIANNKISKKEKVISLSFIAFLFINLYISIMNILWHGLNQPIGFPYRYSFLITFLILIFSYKGLVYNSIVIEKKIVLAIFIFVFVLYSAYLLLSKSDVVGIREILISSIIILVLFTVLLLYNSNKINYAVVIALLSIIQICEIIHNQSDSFKYFSLADNKEYQSYINEVGQIINNIKEEDDSFYRLEKYFRRSHNDSMQFQYNGLTHYSSCEKKEYINFMGNLGFRNNGNWAFYDSGSTAFVDSLFGVKYLVSQYDNSPMYKWHSESENYDVFENEYALPLCFVSDKNELYTDFDGDPFKYQESIADSIIGDGSGIFEKIEGINKKLVNLECTEEDNVFIYRKKDENEDAYIEYEIPLSKEIGRCYFAAPDTQGASIYINGAYDIDYFSQYSWNVYDLGNNKERDISILQLKLHDSELKLSGEYFYYENKDALSKWSEQVKSNRCELKKITSSHLTGYAESIEENKKLVFSIPYEKGWHIYINGNEKEGYISDGIFLAVDIEKGNNNIEIKYKPEGKSIGIIIFLISLVGLLVVLIKEKHYILLLKK